MIVDIHQIERRRTLAVCCLLTAGAIGLSGCVAAAVNSTAVAVKSAPRSELRPHAESGDADAQFALGKSYCCMGPGFDTQTATEWYCKAARQDHADAMYELGRVYLGDVSRTPAPGQKLLRAVTAKRDNAVARLWLTRAAASGHAQASEALRHLDESMSEDDRRRAEQLSAQWPHVPCEYADVFRH